MSNRSLTQILGSYVPLSNVPPAPPSSTIPSFLTKDPSVRFPSTWKAPIGKFLSSRKIAEYQRDGRYGTGLLLPPLLSEHACGECTSRKNTRLCNYSYLPKPGYYCINCRAKYREARAKERESKAAWAERMEAKYI